MSRPSHPTSTRRRRRRLATILAGGLLATSAAVALPAAPAAAAAGGAVGVYTGTLTPAELGVLRAAGVDMVEDLSLRRAVRGEVEVEVVISATQVGRLARQGVDLEPKAGPGARRLAAEAETDGVFRPYSGEGGLAEEIQAIGAAYPDITDVQSIGQTVQGQDILAVRVTHGADTSADGSKPAVLYVAAQHAREWITPEMVRRLLRHVVENDGTDTRVTTLLDEVEMWFVPVANPDGYDYTFTPGNRLWRKNLRDNNGDGQITGTDGVDLNRNFPTFWGYDNEGSSPNPASQTYRGPAPLSEPEDRALDGLMARLLPKYLMNYHSAAELLLYGAGFQVATPTPDDVVYEALLGDDADPAVPFYDPDLSAELYTTNGETTEHAQAAYGILAVTPEMSTCETISNLRDDDAFEPGDCQSGFNFPDDEQLIQEEFERNLPLALATAESALDPDDPVSVVGRDTPDFVIDPFDTSYGTARQQVAVIAARELTGLRMRYSVNGAPSRGAAVTEWQGGERYGDINDVYYAEYRGLVRQAPGDSVEVWFTARDEDGAPTESEHFTYSVAEVARADALVIANEDYTGINPEQDVSAPRYADLYVDALQANGIRTATWDVDAQGVPHHLGVLSHFAGVVWELGDNRLSQTPENATTTTPFGELPDLAVRRSQQDLTISVRDYLNEGGTLLHAGETTNYFGFFGGPLGGIYYGLDGAPDEECVVTGDFFADCLLLADDFAQYWLGVFSRAEVSGPDAVEVTSGPRPGTSFGLAGTPTNPIDEAGAFEVTSSVLPVGEFPQFASHELMEYAGADGADAFLPVEGDYYVGALHEDDSYARIGRTIDLTGVAAGEDPTLELSLSFDTEPSYDNVIVEVHPVGSDDWTTLPDENGQSSTVVPIECEAGFLLAEHPFLTHYLTPGDPCQNTGTTGEWNAFTSSSDGWLATSFDLSAYAGQQIEVVVSYVTDPGTGGIGAFLDDTRVVVGGTVVDAEGFETGLGPWAQVPPPADSPDSAAAFERSTGLVEQLNAAAVATDRTVTLGIGLEQVADPADRAEIVRRAIQAVRMRPAAT